MADETKMPLMGHLEELRRRILYSVLAVGIGFGAAIGFSDGILQWLERPLNVLYEFQWSYPYLVYSLRPEPQRLYFQALTEPFWVHIKVGLVAGVFLTFPFVAYQVWRFVAPGMLPRERQFALPFLLLSTAFFVVGAAFCYFVVLPFGTQFLLAFDPHLVPILTVGHYIDFCLILLLAFGAIFELPLALTLMARLGLITPAFLARNRKYAILGAFVAAAILTPTPDVFNQTLMAGPLIFLYEVGIWSARIFGRRKAPEEAPVLETPIRSQPARPAGGESGVGSQK
ncbi:MAG: twin-arginine translocase subunit TatC [Nitrospirae bacterium]|nr:twin-arginine translocase subunit TatC [Nitrospirota bacterium]